MAQMHPRDGDYKEQQYYMVEEDFVYKDDDCDYSRGSGGMRMMKPDHVRHDNYDDRHRGYGGRSDHHKNGREGYSAAQYSESWYGEERRGDAWKVMKNEFSGHAGKHPPNGHEYPHGGGMRHDGYGAHEGQYGPHREYPRQFSECPVDRNKKAPVWEYKGIRD